MFTHQTFKSKTLEKSIGVRKVTLCHWTVSLLECIGVLLTSVNRRPADSLPSGSRSGQHQEETRHGGARGPGQAVCLRQWVLNRGVGGAGVGGQSCDPEVLGSINSSGVCIVIRQYLAAALIVNHLLFHFPHCFSWWTILSSLLSLFLSASQLVETQDPHFFLLIMESWHINSTGLKFIPQK